MREWEGTEGSGDEGEGGYQLVHNMKETLISWAYSKQIRRLKKEIV